MGGPIALVVAMDRHRVIGRDGQLPWRLPNDLKHFKRLTVGKIVLMGRRTWDSLGRPLPERDNWVLTRDPSFAGIGCRVFRRLEDALAAQGARELMVIGGADLYRQTLPLARRLYVTDIDAAVDGDTVFPDLDAADWIETESEAHPADARHAYPYRFRTLLRRS